MRHKERRERKSYHQPKSTYNSKSNCYFCGGAGPESIIEIQLKDKNKRYRTDEIATVTGIFQVNATDVEHCNFILKDAVAQRE